MRNRTRREFLRTSGLTASGAALSAYAFSFGPGSAAGGGGSSLADDYAGAVDGARRCWGNTIWRLNDAWPILYWSAIDYYLEPKIAYYFLRRAYAPILTCFERTADRICCWVVNDSPEDVSGTLEVRHMDLKGKTFGELKKDVTLPSGQSRRCLDLTPFGPINLRNEFLHARFEHNPIALSDSDETRNTLLLMGERFAHLPSPKLQVRKTDEGIEILTDVFARQVTLEMEGVAGAVYEDNFFDLAPGEKRTISILDPAGGTRLAVCALNAKAIQIDA